MPIPPSTIPAAKQYLFNQITAAFTGTANLQVFLDEPPNDPPVTQDVIVVGDIEQEMEPFQLVGSGGQGWIYEKYHQQVLISVYRGGDEALVVLTQATALASTVANVVRADPSLGGNVLQAYPAAATYQSGWAEGGAGRVTDVEMHINIEAPL